MRKVVFNLLVLFAMIQSIAILIIDKQYYLLGFYIFILLLILLHEIFKIKLGE